MSAALNAGMNMNVRMSVIRIAVFISCLFLQHGLLAQHVSGRTHYPERLRDDVELLRSAIHEAHPDPYRYRTRAELDALIDSVRDSIMMPMTTVEFERTLMPVFRALGDAHCTAEWPPDMQADLRSKATLLPLQVRLLPEGVFVEQELKGFRSIPVGSRIISLNGQPIEAIVERLLATVVCDGANRTYAERVLEREFNIRYHLHIEQATSFTVVYRTPAKTTEQQVIFGMTGNEIASTRKPKGAMLLPWGSTWYADASILWLELRTLDEDSLALAGQRPERFLQALLGEAHKNEVRTMVIDLRGAGGRELAMADLVFSAIAKTPYKVLDDMVVRSIAPPPTRTSHTIPEDFYVSGNARFLVGAQGSYRLPVTDDRLAEQSPMDRAFQGKVYVVCDGHTRDAAAALVMMARRTKRARVVGEEVGSNAFGFTGGPEWVVTAPASGLRFHIPLLKYVPSGRGEGPTDRGEQPNHMAFATPGGIAKGHDAIRAALLEMIRELE